MYKCTNCDWEGKDAKEGKFCKRCGDNVKIDSVQEFKEKHVKEDVNLDLNNDGVVDAKDAKIASKVMNKVRKNKKNKGKR